MSATPKVIVVVVVVTLAAISVIGVCSLALTLFFKAYTDPTILTAFVGITTGAFGGLTGLLANTRQPTQNGSTVSVQTTSETEKPQTITVEPQPEIKP